MCQENEPRTVSLSEYQDFLMDVLNHAVAISGLTKLILRGVETRKVLNVQWLRRLRGETERLERFVRERGARWQSD